MDHPELWDVRARAVRQAIESMPDLMDRYNYTRDVLNEWRGVVKQYAGNPDPASRAAGYAHQAQRTFEEISKIANELRDQIVDDRGGHFLEGPGHVEDA
jgi:hypothetical protein